MAALDGLARCEQGAGVAIRADINPTPRQRGIVGVVTAALIRCRVAVVQIHTRTVAATLASEHDALRKTRDDHPVGEE
jgi:hypothetical protein